MRYKKARRAAVFVGQRQTIGLGGDKRLAARYFGHRDISGVAALTFGNGKMSVFRKAAGLFDEDVQRDALPRHIEPAPAGNTVNVGRKLRFRQFVKFVPVERNGLVDGAVYGNGPIFWVYMRCGPVRKHRPAAHHRLAGRYFFAVVLFRLKAKVNDTHMLSLAESLRTSRGSAIMEAHISCNEVLTSMKIIVTAGGQGTKLWPFSREHKPKQFQAIVGDVSLYTETILTLLKQYEPEDIFISTKHKFIKYISDQSRQIPLKNYIIEPDLAKDRGPGEGLAFLRLSVRHPDEPFFVVQADCVRRPEAAFLKMMQDAEVIVKKNKKLITGGQKALEPDMGVDYLRLGEQLHGNKDQQLFPVEEFVYRGSSYQQTKELIETYNVVTHPQHYCWYPDMMLDAYKKYHPSWYKALMKMRDTFDKPGEDAAIEAIYQDMEKGPTEEVTKHVFNAGQAQVILLPFRWTDIGTWGSVYEYFTNGNQSENYSDGKVVTADATGSLIKTANPSKLVAIAGVEDLVVVDTDDVLLIIPKNKIEKIKDLQKALHEKGEKGYL